MDKKTIYLAGKVTGLPHEQVVEKFKRKQEELEAQGFDVINPVSLLENINMLRADEGVEPFTEWHEIMQMCICFLCGGCHEIHMLPCWQDSKGATLERDIALRVNIPIVYYETY